MRVNHAQIMIVLKKKRIKSRYLMNEIKKKIEKKLSNLKFEKHKWIINNFKISIINLFYAIFYSYFLGFWGFGVLGFENLT